VTTLDDWGQALLAFGEWPVTMEKRIGIVAWAMAEGEISVPRCSGARWNPLDSTEPAPGATDFNSIGVKNYSSEQIGIEATYATLHNGRYPNVLAVLDDEGASAMALAQAVGNSPWGTGTFTKQVEIVKADPPPYFAVSVPGGSGPGPGPLPVPPSEEDDVAFIYQRSDNGAEYYEFKAGTLTHLDPTTSANLSAKGVQTVQVDASDANAAGMTT
jgi:hypothetical protein